MKYAPFFCEENIFHLALDRSNTADQVLLISNTSRQVALAAQKAGVGDAGVVVWDYHVILAEIAEPGRIFDPDSRLGPVVDLTGYLDATFPRELYTLYPELEPVISLITGTEYVRHLSSDRSHMRGPDGNFLKEKPSWPEIYNRVSGNTLFSLVDGTHPAVSGVLSLKEFRQRF